MTAATISVSQTMDLVRQAMTIEWDSFAARHARLAPLLDRDDVAQAAAGELAQDSEFRRVMDEANAAGMSAAVLVEMVRSFVKDWLARLT